MQATAGIVELTTEETYKCTDLTAMQNASLNEKGDNRCKTMHNKRVHVYRYV